MQVKCAFNSQERYELTLGTTPGFVELVRQEIPHCPLVLLPDRKSISFQSDTDYHVNFSCHLTYDTPELNFSICYGIVSQYQPDKYFPLPELFQVQHTSGSRPTTLEIRKQVSIPHGTILRLAINVSTNVSGNIHAENFLLVFQQ